MDTRVRLRRKWENLRLPGPTHSHSLHTPALSLSSHLQAPKMYKMKGEADGESMKVRAHDRGRLVDTRVRLRRKWENLRLPGPTHSHSLHTPAFSLPSQ